MPPKGSTKAQGSQGSNPSPKKKGDSKLQQKSPAEFFANNKGIAGFDNPGKSLYTTVREFVENSLDAAEAMRVLPDVYVKIEELDDVDVGGAAYGVAKQKKEGEGDEAKAAKGKTKNAYYRVSVKDNGCGMAHDDIPNMFGRVLSGTKYSVKQNRGRFGLGAKMALIWSKMSTGQPLHIRSSRGPSHAVTSCILDIDIYKNMPRIISHTKEDNTEGWRGTEISVVIEGSWSPYRARILSYMRQLAVITPYAEFEFRFACPDQSKCFAVRYSRRTDHMPPPAKEVKHHPSSVDLIVLRKIFSDAGEKKYNVKKTLTSQFSSINAAKAAEIIEAAGLDGNTDAGELDETHIKHIRDVFARSSFPQPSGECLSPAGEYNLRLGILKELKPDMVATFQEPVHVFEGHPFIVEAGVALGGKSVAPGINVYRFANRIPLLFEGGADVATRTACTKINWKMYKINPATDRIGVFVSTVSTKIPFKGTGKEYIGDDAEAIAEAVKHAVMQCCLQLRTKLRQGAALKEKAQRKANLVKYIPNAAMAIFGVVDKLAEEDPSHMPPSKRIKLFQGSSCVALGERVRSEWAGEDVLRKVRAKDVTVGTLKKKLETLIEQANYTDMFESVAAQGPQHGLERIALHLAPSDQSAALVHVRHPAVTFAFLPGAMVDPV
eukprot:comp45461_c0_seq1/m.47536 comp45461_c0_seq1/g.47536  ORF comp45461_c0_seq1/g.47536 comp45461_c0_seq1/m.47536 type:complete len:663 (-) comp45461_c0_seq1:37-2025(-)